MTAPMTKHQTRAAAEALCAYAAFERAGCNVAPRRERRVLVTAGGHRFDVPPTAPAAAVFQVQARLAGIFGSAYLESDGAPLVAGAEPASAQPERVPTNRGTDAATTGADRVAAILAARRRSAGNP